MERETNGALTENLKKGLTELLVLQCLASRPMTIYELVKILDEKSNSICKISYPYAVMYRLQDNGYISEGGKRISDNRKRAYYRITGLGVDRLEAMKKEYNQFITGMNMLFKFLGSIEEDDKWDAANI